MRKQTLIKTHEIQITVKIVNKTKNVTATVIYCPPKYQLGEENYLRLS